MQTLYGLLRIFRDYILLAVLSGLSLFLIAHSESAPVRVLRSFSILTFASLQSSSNWALGIFSASQDAEKLRDVNVTLMEEVMQLRQLRQENLGHQRAGTGRENRRDDTWLRGRPARAAP